MKVNTRRKFIFRIEYFINHLLAIDYNPIIFSFAMDLLNIFLIVLVSSQYFVACFSLPLELLLTL